MTILVTGATGAIGSQVVAQLVQNGATVHALARTPEKARFPAGVTPVKGDMTDVDAMRAALADVRTLFLLNAVTPDEVTQALITLNLARDAGIERIVYFSVLHSDLYANVPHFTGKHTVERMIEQFDLPATILRPAYFIQNDASLKDAVLGHGIYPMPVGSVGLSMVDTRDIAEVVALKLLERDRAATPLPRETIDLVGPDLLTGPVLADLWSTALKRPIQYAGNDLPGFEQRFKAFIPGWMAYDMRLMMGRFQQDGMVARPGDVERLTSLLGRPLRSYRDFAVETAAEWQRA
ncbi:MAG TPA: NmrA/HSCARG family protein [Aliidongia sp.]|uniref:SDR family oxidoreductase n=1 Tax=Aliidongia sp. TaxID=1914230 RepID=UPI002DDD120A|nr:NmrA/HSCARG family protein [Aliidongia sp.]HEV2676133.1 NmrA/HSCARG family protein [Aliidongia sp.]